MPAGPTEDALARGQGRPAKTAPELNFLIHKAANR